SFLTSLEGFLVSVNLPPIVDFFFLSIGLQYCRFVLISLIGATNSSIF
ncbi:unnamed protein product, partial [Linum tenue]